VSLIVIGKKMCTAPKIECVIVSLIVIGKKMCTAPKIERIIKQRIAARKTKMSCIAVAPTTQIIAT
jgi:hypothetical protein